MSDPSPPVWYHSGDPLEQAHLLAGHLNYVNEHFDEVIDQAESYLVALIEYSTVPARGRYFADECIRQIRERARHLRAQAC